MPDSRSIAVQDGGRAIAAPSNSENFLAMLLEAARDPTIDAGKMESMARLAVDLQDRERKAQFNRDLVAAQLEMPRISKRGRIVIPGRDGRADREQGRYAKFEDIDRFCRPILAKHNLSISFRTGTGGGKVTVTPVLRHSNGYEDIGEPLELPADTSGSKNNTQAVVSAVSYGKRTAYKAALNIIEEGEDDDGNLGRYPSDPMLDWQHSGLASAEEAAEAGRYPEWYGGLEDVKLRAWLVQTGHHARLGGAPPLPGSSPAPEAERLKQSEPTRSESRQETRSDPPAQKAKRTPAQLTEDYIAGLSGLRDLGELVNYQASAAKFLGGLRDKHPELHRRCVDANSKRYGELQGEPAPAADASDLFGDD